ncbi:MAG TPA: T9SS type A sorting domain-containing protein [Daejeonella sp.]
MKQIQLYKLLALLVLAPMMQTANAQMRLKARSFYAYLSPAYPYYLADSMSCTYQGTRGSDDDFDLTGFGADQYSHWQVDPATNQADEFTRGYNTYDSKGNIIRTAFGYVTGSQLDTSDLFDYTYDANDRMTLLTHRKMSTSGWYGEKRIAYTYDAQGNLTEQVQEKWDLGQSTWVNDKRTVNTYASSKLIQELKYAWISGVWEYTDRQTIHYTGNNPDTILNEQYFYGPQVWDTMTREVYFYNTANDNDTLLIYDYYTSLPHWRDPRYRHIHVYDNNHNRLSQTVQKYNGTIFENTGRERKAYNASNLITSIIYDKWSTAANQFEVDTNAGLEFRYYEPLTASVGMIENNGQFRLYPNPASTQLHVQMIVPTGSGLLDFAIYDQSGRLIRHWHELHTGTYNRSIDISGLANGVYFLRSINTRLSQQFMVSH